MESIIQHEKECYFCGTTQDLHDHHIYLGKNRSNAEKYGIKVYLCAKHHNMSDDSVHFNRIYMKLMKVIGQLYFERENEEDFEKIFRRNYLC